MQFQKLQDSVDKYDKGIQKDEKSWGDQIQKEGVLVESKGKLSFSVWQMNKARAKEAKLARE